jgi:hypothetical protein
MTDDDAGGVDFDEELFWLGVWDGGFFVGEGVGAFGMVGADNLLGLGCHCASVTGIDGRRWSYEDVLLWVRYR